MADDDPERTKPRLADQDEQLGLAFAASRKVVEPLLNQLRAGQARRVHERCMANGPARLGEVRQGRV